MAVIIEILVYIFTFLFPIVFAFFGQANITSSLLSAVKINNVCIFSSNDILRIKDICSFISIFLSFLPLGILLVKNKIKNNQLYRQQNFLLQQIKIFLLHAFESKVNQTNTNINIRIFVHRNGCIKKILVKTMEIFKQRPKITFRMKNIIGFTDNNIKDGLSFEAYPMTQGLVGECYNQRKIVYDENLKTSTRDYNLTDFQKEQTHNTIFCLCVPLFNTKNEVYAIITLDSEIEITIPDDKKYDLFNLLRSFGKRFGEEMAHLFR